MEYIVTVMVIAVLALIVLGIRHVQQENAPGPRPSLRAARLALRQSRILASGDLCVCGGTLGQTAEISPQIGTLLGCSDCSRCWTMDGRWIVRRRRRRTAARRGPGSPSDLRRGRRFVDRPRSGRAAS